MDLPVTTSSLSQQQSPAVEKQPSAAPLPSPLALDGWEAEEIDLDAWTADPNADELLEGDLLNLFRDAEEVMVQGAVLDQDTGNDGDTSSVMSEMDMSPLAGWLERDLLSLSDDSDEADSSSGNACPAGQSSSSSSSSGGRSSSIECYGQSQNTGRDTTSTATWSTASVSEDSDDGSRSSLSSCTVHAAPASAPASAGIGYTQQQQQQQQPVPISGASPCGAASKSTGLPPLHQRSHTDNNKRCALPVSSGAGTPILPSTFAPAFVAGSGGAAAAPNIVSSTTAAMSSALPNFGDLQAAALAAASGAAGQAIAAGWKRLRAGEQFKVGAVGEKDGGADGQPRLLSSLRDSSGDPVGSGRVNKRVKREERLMKNREAANRSRVKRKEVLGELENRAATLSSSLVESRNETAALTQEVASLREQNSFLRGMLTAAGSAMDLPPILPTSTNRTDVAVTNGGGGGGGGGSGGGLAAGASAIIGAMGTALAVVSCVALSAAGFGDRVDGERMGSGSERGAGMRGDGSRLKMGGRRMLLSLDDYPVDMQSEDASVGWGGRFALQPEVVYWAWVCMALAVVLGLLFAVARWAYGAARPRVGKGGGRAGGVQQQQQQRQRSLRGAQQGLWPLRSSFGKIRKLV